MRMRRLNGKILICIIAFTLIMSQMALFPGATVSAATVKPNVSPPQGRYDYFGLRFVNNTSQALPSRIVTFGQTFAEGDVPPGTDLTLVVGDIQLPMQTNIKATHSDGSIRHAIFNVQLPALAANGSVDAMMTEVSEETEEGIPASGPNVDVGDILDRGYDVEIDLTLGGTTYVVKAQDALSDAISRGTAENWFVGPLASEVRVEAPITPDNKLHAYFDIRSYADGVVRTDVVIANDWAYVTGMTAPVTYDVALKKDGQTAVAYTELAHNQHANWHKEIWWSGNDPDINVVHDVNYLLKSGSIPDYDTSIGVNDNIIQQDYNSLTAANTAPMGNALVEKAMPGTGGRSDLGPTTAWNARYILSQDARAWQVVLANANAGGSIPWHVRDDATGEYIRIDDRPDLWIDDRDEGTNKFPEPFTEANTGWLLDTAHQPALQYIPYLFTGSHYYLDEMQAQASYVIGSYDPGYNSGLGVFDHVNVRAIAWSLRDIADAAYITPDDHPLKDYFATILDNNLDHYVEKYVTNRAEQASGAIEGFFLDGYSPDSVAPWQQDFMAIVLRHMEQRGYSQATELLDWMYNFNAGRFINADNGFDPFAGPGYWWWIKDSDGYFNSWSQLYAKNVAAGNISGNLAGLDGYPAWSGGYAANAKGALAGLISSTYSPESIEAFAYLVGQTPRMTADYANDPTWLQAPKLADGKFLNYADIHVMSSADTYNGSNSNELLHGSDGNDTLYGSGGIDILYGDDGDDYLHGGDGDDFLFGNQGNDILVGGSGSDVLKGGSGADTFVFDAANSHDADTVLDFAPGEDTLEILEDLGGNGMTTAAQVLSGATTSDGNTLLHLGGSYTVTLKGVLPAQLDEGMIHMVDSASTPPPPSTPEPAPTTYNAAAGKTGITTNGTIANGAPLSYLTDGDRHNQSYVLIALDGSPRWVQVDLGKEVPIVELNLVNDYSTSRTGRDIIMQLSNDPSFATGVTTVFNNDADNSSGLGIGTDAEYLEPSDGSGKTVTLSEPVLAQYVRVWSYGHLRTGETDYRPVNTPVEIEVYALTKFEINGALRKTVTTDDNAVILNGASLSLLTDGLKSDTGQYVLISVSGGPQYYQVDLGATEEITRVHLTNDWNPGATRTGRDVIAQLSDDETFSSGVTTIFNNDSDNSSGLGIGTDEEYLEPVDGSGKSIVLDSPVHARYVRVWGYGHVRTNGNEFKSVNTPVEIEVYILKYDITAPAAVTNLSAGYVTWNSVELKWTAPGNDDDAGTALSYDIRYSIEPITEDNWDSAIQVSGEPVPQAAGKEQSMKVSGLTPGTAWYFAMKTSDNVGNTSGLSNVLAAATLAADTVSPSAISDLVATGPNPHSVQLEWTAPGNDGNMGTAGSYDIRYSTSPITDANFQSAPQADITIIPAAAGEEQIFKVLGLQTDVTYYFAVKTADESGNVSELSNAASATTRSYTPDEVTVSSLAELQSAIDNAPFAGRIITLTAGTYEQSAQIYIHNKNNITIQGATSNFGDTVIAGQGMDSTQVTNISVDQSDYITIRDLTLRDTQYHGIKIDNGSCYFRAFNVKTWDNGESGYKITSRVVGTNVSNNYSDYGMIENSLIGFTTEGKRGVVEGIDGVGVKGWIIRGNVVENIKRPNDGIAYGIFFKGNSIDTVIENNLIKNSFIALSFGGGGTDPAVVRNGDTTYEHRGGIMRNNIIWGTVDTGIYMNQAHDFKVYNNTVWSSTEHPNSIESRFAGSSGEIRNNIASMQIANRDGGTSVLSNNITEAADDMFADAAGGDFHLLGTATTAIDQGYTLPEDVAFDFDGNARPGGSSYDIGAYEYIVPTNHSGNQGTSTNTGDTTSTKSGLAVMVNGKSESFGQLSKSSRNGQKVATVTLDAKKLKEVLETAGEHAVIRIPVPSAFDVVVGQLNGQTVSDLAQQQASIEIRTAAGSYTLTAEQLGIQSLVEQLGAGSDLEGIQVDVEIASPSGDSVKMVEDAAAQDGFSLVVPPLSFTVKAAYGDKTVELTRFDSYVERTIAIPDGVDPAKITTAVVVEAGGSVRHVPTQIVQVDGRWVARINSVTNSLYALVGNSHSFADVAQHWAKDAVNEMGSRMIVSGLNAERFGPDQAITRAELAAILVRGLGLKPDAGPSSFTDIKGTDWYADSVRAAYDFGLISGFEDGAFRPLETITREQAMVMVANAMKLTGLTTGATPSASEQLGAFADAGSVAGWAKISVAANIEAGIVSGRSSTELAPKDAITRAEVAVIVQRLLQKSELI